LPFARVRIRTIWKPEAALTCAEPDPAALTALGVGGSRIELSEWVRWGNLRPELLGGLNMTADVGEAEGRRHFVTTAGKIV
jgi:hypothetical protein